MPSKRKQINVRLSDESLVRLLALVDRMRAATGMPLSQSDVIQAGLMELEKKYPPTSSPAEAAGQKNGGKGRQRKQEG